MWSSGDPRRDVVARSQLRQARLTNSRVTPYIRLVATEEQTPAIRRVGTTEAAELLGVVPRTLYRLIDEGQIPAYKMGRVIRMKAEDLDEFLESMRVEPGSLRHLYPSDPARD